jgi:hypothetical protein
MRIPQEDPRFTLDRIRQQREEQEANTFSEAAARAANYQLQSIMAQYRTKRAAEVDGWMDSTKKANAATRDAEADQWLRDQISAINLEMLSSGANLRFNPAKEAFEPVLRGGGVGALDNGENGGAPRTLGPTMEEMGATRGSNGSASSGLAYDPLNVLRRKRPTATPQAATVEVPEMFRRPIRTAPTVPRTDAGTAGSPSRASVPPEGYGVFIDDAEYNRQIAAMSLDDQKKARARARAEIARVLGIAGSISEAELNRALKDPSSEVWRLVNSMDPETRSRIYRAALDQPSPAMFR